MKCPTNLHVLFQQAGMSMCTDTVSAKWNANNTLFHTIVNMIALLEGDIIHNSHPEFDEAVNNALYGIQISSDSRLVYDKNYGLDLVKFV